jgi:ADP-ribosylglycohydrolase
MSIIQQRLHLAATSLKGLSIGDAFGETFFGKEEIILQRLADRSLQEGKWLFTDDTVMAIGIFNQLFINGSIDQNSLAAEFAKNYSLDDHRGYGGTAHSILRSIGEGHHWKEVSASVFDGIGSLGNGAAMRAAPIGVYFNDDIEKIILQTRLSAEITHFKEEAINGAIAVALAACFASKGVNENYTRSFFDFILTHTPPGDVQSKIAKATTLPATTDIRTLVSVLGNGIHLTAKDTVPFALWCAAHYPRDFEEALWKAVSALGDRDTICAITGSIVALSTQKPIPVQWEEQTERIGRSPFINGDAAIFFG